MLRGLLLVGAILGLSACGALRRPAEPTFNQKMLKAQQDQIKSGKNPMDEEVMRPTGDAVQSSLWAKSVGSPYIIRNQKAQKVGDLLTILVEESANATTSAKTDTKKESTNSVDGKLGYGATGIKSQGNFSADAGSKNEFKGEGKTDRSGRFTATVQAVVENVLPNGTLFVRGQKVVTLNNEDQEIEISGFVRPDDIRINNQVISSMLADAKIRYLGDGVISDKQRVGWGTRLMDAVWPF